MRFGDLKKAEAKKAAAKKRLELHSWQPVQRGRKELMHKAKASQRKDTLASCVPPHPDVEPARKMLCEMV